MRAFHKSNNTRTSSDYITKKHAKTLIEVIKSNSKTNYDNNVKIKTCENSKKITNVESYNLFLNLTKGKYYTEQNNNINIESDGSISNINDFSNNLNYKNCNVNIKINKYSYSTIDLDWNLTEGSFYISNEYTKKNSNNKPSCNKYSKSIISNDYKINNILANSENINPNIPYLKGGNLALVRWNEKKTPSCFKFPQTICLSISAPAPAPAITYILSPQTTTFNEISGQLMNSPWWNNSGILTQQYVTNIQNIVKQNFSSNQIPRLIFAIGWYTDGVPEGQQVSTMIPQAIGDANANWPQKNYYNIYANSEIYANNFSHYPETTNNSNVSSNIWWVYPA